MNRRRALQAIGLGALAAPQAAGQLRGGLSAPNLATPTGPSKTPYPQWPECSQEKPSPLSFSEMAKLALADPETRQRMIDVVWRENRIVMQLDPDLAVNRSISLCAKIVFQRQRNVERQLAHMQDESSLDVLGVVRKFFWGRSA